MAIFFRARRLQAMPRGEFDRWSAMKLMIAQRKRPAITIATAWPMPKKTKPAAKSAASSARAARQSQKPRPGASASPRSIAGNAGSVSTAKPHPRVDQCVSDIDRDAHEHERGCPNHEDGHDH